MYKDYGRRGKVAPALLPATSNVTSHRWPRSWQYSSSTIFRVLCHPVSKAKLRKHGATSIPVRASDGVVGAGDGLAVCRGASADVSAGSAEPLQYGARGDPLDSGGAKR